MSNPLYDLYYTFETILKRVKDVNAERYNLAPPGNKWIWPEIPTSLDGFYPRITIQFSNLEEQPVSAGSYVEDNLKTDDETKTITTGRLYNVTIWIGLFVKTELMYTIDRPDGSEAYAKNALLGNLLFSSIIAEIDKAEQEIKDVAFGYIPSRKTFSLNYEDSSKRIINSMSIVIPIISETELTLLETDLINVVTNNYSIS